MNINVKAGVTWLNVSLTPIPKENSIINGYVRDAVNGKAIKNVTVHLYWEDNKGNHMRNSTHTDENGFYLIRVASGSIKLDFYANGYFFKDTDYFYIEKKTKQNGSIFLFIQGQKKIQLCVDMYMMRIHKNL